MTTGAYLTTCAWCGSEYGSPRTYPGNTGICVDCDAHLAREAALVDRLRHDPPEPSEPPERMDLRPLLLGVPLSFALWLALILGAYWIFLRLAPGNVILALFGWLL